MSQSLRWWRTTVGSFLGCTRAMNPVAADVSRRCPSAARGAKQRGLTSAATDGKGGSWRGVCLPALLMAWSLAAAPGDVRVTIQDMEGRALAAGSGAAVTLRGTDDSGYRTVGTQTPDADGVVVFSAATIAAATTGTFHFVVESAVVGCEVRALLYDPFGRDYTYVAYQAAADYDFTLPTPTNGQAAPQVTWDGANSQLRFSIDLGSRTMADFWFIRPVWQKKAADAQWAGSGYGLLPLISADWFAGHGYAVADGGLSTGHMGSVRVTRGSYDQTFLARKESLSGGLTPAYTLYLVNCLWNHELPATYDPTGKVCVVTFDPTSVFGDSSAPGWEGAAMKDGVPYFLALQAEAWIWHEAGVSGGLAVDWGGGVAPAVLAPVRINDQTIRLELLSKAGSECRVRVRGNAGLPYRIESADALGAAAPWQLLQTVNPTVSPFEFTDTAAPAAGRFYRVRQY